MFERLWKPVLVLVNYVNPIESISCRTNFIAYFLGLVFVSPNVGESP